MKKGKYIDYNIILACLSHKRKIQIVKQEPLASSDVLMYTRIISLRQERGEQRVA